MAVLLLYLVKSDDGVRCCTGAYTGQVTFYLSPCMYLIILQTWPLLSPKYLATGSPAWILINMLSFSLYLKGSHGQSYFPTVHCIFPRHINRVPGLKPHLVLQLVPKRFSRSIIFSHRSLPFPTIAWIFPRYFTFWGAHPSPRPSSRRAPAPARAPSGWSTTQTPGTRGTYW